MRDTPLLQRLLVVASVLAILAAAFTWLPQAVVSIASSGELEIDIDTDSLGLSDYVVEWALLTVPRHGAYHAEVGEKGGLLSLKFRLGELLQGAESGGAERPLAAPVVTVKLTDFNGGKTVGLVIPSSFILSLKLNGGKPLTAAELQSMLSKDPLKALRVGKVVVGPRELAMLKSLGLVRESPIERGPLPEGASARMLGNLELPPKGGLCGGRVYHLVNYSSAVWREPTPSWWRERFTHTGGDGDADSYWKRFKSYLGAGYYLASTDYSLNDAISCIARHVNPSSEREGGETSLYSMDAFIGGNRWNDTYPAGSIIYAGPIPLFSYEIQNEAGASGSRAFVVHVTLDVGPLQSSLSGLLAGGYLLGASESTNSSADSYSETLYAHNAKRSIYVFGTVTSLGDHILVHWDIRGPVEAGGGRYWVIVPHAIIVPLYTVALDLGELYVYDGDGPGGPALLVDPGVSFLLRGVRYGPENYTADPDNPVIFRLDLGGSGAGAGSGFDAIMGSPVYKFAIAVFDYDVEGAYEKLAARLASRLLDTGYIHATYRGELAFLHYEIIKGEPPRGSYSITLYSNVPKSLDGVDGVDSLVWGRITFSIHGTAASTPP